MGDQVIDRPVEMAASGDPAVYGMQPALPAEYRLCGRATMLEEMQRTIWLEHSMNLSQRGIHGWDSAQRVGGQHAVHRSIRQSEPGTIAPYPLDRRRRRRLARLREAHGRL
jgi:hypothetical protein